MHSRKAQRSRAGQTSSWLELVLDEGKNRQIRRMMESMGVEVLRLVRVSIGPLQLGDLGKGEYRALTVDEKRMLDRAMLEMGRADGRLVREAREGPGQARFGETPAGLDARLLSALAKVGIERLYEHQAEAVAAAWQGPAIVTTGTASGKSLCFNLPTLDVLCRDSRARAVYLYPTKALAQDQARALADASHALCTLAVVRCRELHFLSARVGRGAADTQ